MTETNSEPILCNFPLVQLYFDIVYVLILQTLTEYMKNQKRVSPGIQPPNQKSNSTTNKKAEHEPEPQHEPSNQNQYRLKQQLKKLMECPYNNSVNIISKNRMQVQCQFSIHADQSIEQQQGLVFWEEHERGKDTIRFLIVLHQMYPWCPPLVLCLSQVMFPRLDDYRDYLEDIIQGQWWPNITVYDIITMTSKFVNKIFNKYSIVNSGIRTSLEYGKRTISESIPHTMDCILRNCKGLTLCRGKYYNNQDVLLGKYENIHRIVGLSWSDIVIFKVRNFSTSVSTNSRQSKFQMVKKWTVRQIKKIASKKKGTKIQKKTIKVVDLNGKNRKQIEQRIIQKYEFCIQMMDGKKQYIKINFEQNQKVSGKQKDGVKQRRRLNEEVNCSIVFQQKSEINGDGNQCQRKLEEYEEKNYGKVANEDIEKRQRTPMPEQSEVNIRMSSSKEQQSRSESVIFEQPMLKADQRMDQKVESKHKPLSVPEYSCQHNLQILRHLIQYIQLRECVLASDQSLETKIRMLSQIIENSSELEEQKQLWMYYQSKLKQVISNQYLANQSDLTSKFQFDI